MTRPVNLYLLSRIHSKTAFNDVNRHTALKQSRTQTPIHEIESLRIFADRMISEGVSVDALDGFFFGYSIPRIGKEFDLLKFNDTGCLGIELKSQPVPLEQIRSQLRRNRHYLSHLGLSMELYTFVSDTRQCFRLTEANTLISAAPSDIAKAVLSFSGPHVQEIDGLFQPSEYIVSPARTPEKFLGGEYFLTQAQDQISRDLLAALNDTTGLAYFSLTGKPGSGKTLLLYDVARSLGTLAQTAILYWGELTEGHEMINRANIGLKILPWSVMGESQPAISRPNTETKPSPRSVMEAEPGLERPPLAPYSYVLVDESHRLTPEQFELLCRTAKQYRQRIVFCLDPEQILTTREKANDIAGRVAALPLSGTFVLNERLRGNRELQAFIQEVRDLQARPEVHMDFRDVEIGYASTIAEAQNQLAYYRERGYVFLNYLKTAREEMDVDEAAGGIAEDSVDDAEARAANGAEDGAADDPAAVDASSAADPVLGGNPFAEFEGGYDIHHIIGQEFDRVVMLLDNSFYYTEDGKLEGIPRPDPDLLYPNLFYQSITRVQEKLALIVLENEPLFDRIAEILR